MTGNLLADRALQLIGVWGTLEVAAMLALAIGAYVVARREGR